jgi:hypothetical protein
VITLPVGDSITLLVHRDLVEFAEIDENLYAIEVRSRRTRLHELGAIRDMRSEIESMHHAISRLNRSGASDSSRAAGRDVLRRVGDDLARRLIPPAVALRSTPLVVVGSGAIHSMPWAAVEAVRGRAVSVAPSLRACVQAITSRRPVRRAALIAGPGLAHADGEIERLMKLFSMRDVVPADQSTVARCLPVLERADLAHLACHGSFRADNPLFSSLRVADGDLFIHDLERCRQLPATIVLSACEAGQQAELRGGALLGLASALVQLGVSSVIAPLTPVNDEGSVDLMVRLHTHLADGVDPAAALALASIGPDGALDPTAAPFICFGS